MTHSFKNAILFIQSEEPKSLSDPFKYTFLFMWSFCKHTYCTGSSYGNHQFYKLLWTGSSNSDSRTTKQKAVKLHTTQTYFSENICVHKETKKSQQQHRKPSNDHTLISHSEAKCRCLCMLGNWARDSSFSKVAFFPSTL